MEGTWDLCQEKTEGDIIAHFKMKRCPTEDQDLFPHCSKRVKAQSKGLNYKKAGSDCVSGKQLPNNNSSAAVEPINQR